MSSRKRKTNSKKPKLTGFSRCRECGDMLNNETGKYVITAARDVFCDSCYYGKGWQNLSKPYDNYSEGRETKKIKYK